jgi:hypothetical protein
VSAAGDSLLFVPKSELDRHRTVNRVELGGGEATKLFRDAVLGDSTDLVGDGA